MKTLKEIKTIVDAELQTFSAHEILTMNVFDYRTLRTQQIINEDIMTTSEIIEFIDTFIFWLESPQAEKVEFPDKEELILMKNHLLRISKLAN